MTAAVALVLSTVKVSDVVPLVFPTLSVLVNVFAPGALGLAVHWYVVDWYGPPDGVETVSAFESTRSSRSPGTSRKPVLRAHRSPC